MHFVAFSESLVLNFRFAKATILTHLIFEHCVFKSLPTRIIIVIYISKKYINVRSSRNGGISNLKLKNNY